MPNDTMKVINKRRKIKLKAKNQNPRPALTDMITEEAIQCGRNRSLKKHNPPSRNHTT